MRIISKLHDFYDAVMSFGHTDNAYIFNRTTETIKPTIQEAENLFDVIFDELDSESLQLHQMIYRARHYGMSSSNFVKHGYLAFCGTVYPFIQIQQSTSIRFGNWDGAIACNELFNSGVKTKFDNNIVTFFDEESALRFMNKLNKNNFFKLGNGNKAEYDYWLDFIKLFFKAAPKPFVNEFAKEYSIKLGSPYFMVSNLASRRYTDNLEVTKTPELKSLQFQKVVDANTAYQEISMFFCGVIGNQEKEIISISDKDLRDAKGFNDKSFKAEKSTKKRKQK